MSVHLELTDEEWSGLISWLHAGTEYAELLSRVALRKGPLPKVDGKRICRNCGESEQYADGRCAPCSRRRNNAIQQRERAAAKAKQNEAP